MSQSPSDMSLFVPSASDRRVSAGAVSTTSALKPIRPTASLPGSNGPSHSSDIASDNVTSDVSASSPLQVISALSAIGQKRRSDDAHAHATNDRSAYDLEPIAKKTRRGPANDRKRRREEDTPGRPFPKRARLNPDPIDDGPSTSAVESSAIVPAGQRKRKASDDLSPKVEDRQVKPCRSMRPIANLRSAAIRSAGARPQLLIDFPGWDAAHAIDLTKEVDEAVVSPWARIWAVRREEKERRLSFLRGSAEATLAKYAAMLEAQEEEEEVRAVSVEVEGEAAPVEEAVEQEQEEEVAEAGVAPIASQRCLSPTPSPSTSPISDPVEAVEEPMAPISITITTATPLPSSAHSTGTNTPTVGLYPTWTPQAVAHVEAVEVSKLSQVTSMVDAVEADSTVGTGSVSAEEAVESVPVVAVKEEVESEEEEEENEQEEEEEEEVASVKEEEVEVKEEKEQEAESPAPVHPSPSPSPVEIATPTTPIIPPTPTFTQSTITPSPPVTPSDCPATVSFGWSARPRELLPVWEEADSDEEGEETCQVKAPARRDSTPPVLTAPTRPSWMQPSRFFHGALAPAAPIRQTVEAIIAEEEPVVEAEPIAPIAQTSEPVEEVAAEEKPVVAEEEPVVEAEPLAPTITVPPVAPSWLQPARFFNVASPVLPAVPSRVPSPQSSPDLVPSLVAPPMPISNPEPMPMPVFVPVSAPSPSPAPPSVFRPERVIFPQFTHARIPVMPKKEASAEFTPSFFDGFRETRQATEVADVEMDETGKMDEMEVEPTHRSVYERPAIDFGPAAGGEDSDMEVETQMPRSHIDAPLVPLQDFIPFAPTTSNASSWNFARPSGFGQFHSAPVVPAAQPFVPSSSVEAPMPSASHMPVADLFALLADQHEAEDEEQDTPMGAYPLSDDDDDMDGDDERSDGRRSDAPEPIEIVNTTTGEVFTWADDERSDVEQNSGDDDDMLLDLDDDYCPRYRARHGDGEDEDEMDPMDELVMMTRAAEVRPRRSKVHPAWKRMTEAQRDSLSDDEWDYLMGWTDEAPESLSRLLVENDDELADDEGEEEEEEEDEVAAGPSRHHGQRSQDDEDNDDVANGLEGVVERLDQDGVVWMNGPLAPWESGVEGEIEAPMPEMSEADREMAFLAYQMEEWGNIGRVEQPFEASDIDPNLDAMFEVKTERATEEVDIADVLANFQIDPSSSGERNVSIAELGAMMGDMAVAGAGQQEEVDEDEIQIKQERISVVDEGEDRAARDAAVGTFDYDDSDDEDVPKYAEGSMAELGALLGGMAVAGAGQEEEEDDEIQIKQERISVVDEGEDRAARDAAVGTFDYTDSEDEDEDEEPARQFDRKGKGVDRSGGA